MSIIHLLWVPLAYKIAPIWLGHQSLRGFLRQSGVDILGIPLPVSKALAVEAYKIHRYKVRFGRLGLFAALADYTKSLEITALQVRALFHEPNRKDGFLSTCHRQKRIIEKFGIVVPPVLVDEHNRIVG